MSKLTAEERNALKALGIFSERQDKPCEDCLGYHLRACPRVKSQEWLGNGNRVKVEYFPNGEWEENVIFAEDIYDESEPDDVR